jgi:hypothetical protein
MNRSIALAGGLALAATLALMASALPANELPTAPPNDTVQTWQGHPYACTGIAESKYDPRWDAFPLKFVVATVEGDYLGDFTVTITDGSGATVMDAHCLAPWLLVDLPAGNYTARVVARGTFEKTLDVAVGSGQKELTVHFEGINET